jgi:bacteriorhodopsin
MSGVIAKLIEMLVKYAVIPLFSKLIFEIVAYFQNKKAETERNENIDKAVKEFEEAVTEKEKEDAFFALVRGRKPD